MYNQGNMRLHVDLFIKYASNNVYSDNNLGQPQSILNICLTFFSSLYFMTTFCGLFSVWYWYHCFFLLGGMKMSGSAGLFSKKKKKNYLVGSPKVGGAGDGKHKKNYGHPNHDGIITWRDRHINLAWHNRPDPVTASTEHLNSLHNLVDQFPE